MSVFDMDEVVGFEGSFSYDSSKSDGASRKLCNDWHIGETEK